MNRETRWLRETYVDLLLEYAKKDPRIVLVEADLAKAAGTDRFQRELPERVINVGIAEASMISTAAGMAAMGKLPFTHTFTAFSSRRVCDQVTLSVAYAGLKVVIMGSDPGVTAELNGGTHMSMEDMAIMRNIPGMLIYEPVDSAQLRLAFPQILAHDGPVYIRLLRRAAIQVYREDSPFQLGKGAVLREGRDVSVFATGIMVAEALEAAQLLEEEGIDAEIINIHTLKPLDRQLVLDSAQKTGAVVTAENHSVLNALGSAVAEVLAEECPAPLTRVGIQDHFGEVGSTQFLQQKYGLTAQAIVQAAHSSIKKRGNVEMKLAIGSDKSGFSLKEAIKAYLAERGIQADDLGTLDPERAKPYFEVASTIAPMVQNGTYDRAILICGTGMGMAVVANKYQGVYAAVCESTYAAEKCRAINDANILTMGGWIIGEQLGCTMAERFLDTHFTQGLEKWRCEFLTSAREKVKQLETDIYQK